MRYRLDFIWLLHGRRMDHTTLSKFRTKFRKPLKGLFRQIGRLAMTLGLIRLGACDNQRTLKVAKPWLALPGLQIG